MGTHISSRNNAQIMGTTTAYFLSIIMGTILYTLLKICAIIDQHN